MKLVLLFDGLCQGPNGETKNPGGVGAWGYILWAGAKMKFTDSGHLGNPEWMTNNYAEYCALGFGLKKILSLNLEKADSLLILGDSDLVVSQITGQWKINSESLKPLYERCIEYLHKINIPWRAHWIPRDLNTETDGLSRDGFNKWKAKK